MRKPHNCLSVNGRKYFTKLTICFVNDVESLQKLQSICGIHFCQPSTSFTENISFIEFIYGEILQCEGITHYYTLYHMAMSDFQKYFTKVNDVESLQKLQSICGIKSCICSAIFANLRRHLRKI